MTSIGTSAQESEEERRKRERADELLDQALEQTFPASDVPAVALEPSPRPRPDGR